MKQFYRYYLLFICNLFFMYYICILYENIVKKCQDNFQLFSLTIISEIFYDYYMKLYEVLILVFDFKQILDYKLRFF